MERDFYIFEAEIETGQMAALKSVEMGKMTAPKSAKIKGVMAWGGVGAVVDFLEDSRETPK